MTTLTQNTGRKLSLLHLAEELGNVSKACKIMGYHRDTFYAKWFIDGEPSDAYGR